MNNVTKEQISKTIIGFIMTLINIIIEFCLKQNLNLDEHAASYLKNTNLLEIPNGLDGIFVLEIENSKIQQSNIYLIIFFIIAVSSIVVMLTLFCIDKIDFKFKTKTIVVITITTIVVIVCNALSIYNATSFEIPCISQLPYNNCQIPKFDEIKDNESGNTMLLTNNQTNCSNNVRSFDIIFVKCYIYIPMILIFDIYTLLLLMLWFSKIEISIINFESLIEIIQKIMSKDT